MVRCGCPSLSGIKPDGLGMETLIITQQHPRPMALQDGQPICWLLSWQSETLMDNAMAISYLMDTVLHNKLFRYR